jgi:hypothetical protein
LTGGILTRIFGDLFKVSCAQGRRVPGAKRGRAGAIAGAKRQPFRSVPNDNVCGLHPCRGGRPAQLFDEDIAQRAQFITHPSRIRPIKFQDFDDRPIGAGKEPVAILSRLSAGFIAAQVERLGCRLSRVSRRCAARLSGCAVLAP